MAETIRIVIEGDADRLVSEARRAGLAVSALGRTTSAQARAASAFNAVASQQSRNLAAVGRAARTAAFIGVGALTAALGASVKAAIDFESAFAEVRKTVDTNEAGFRRIERSLRDLAREIPISADELARLAGQAGALGIEADAIVDFTRTVADLGVTTDLSADQAADAVARIANVMGTARTDFDRLGSTLVELGNKGASTESEITQMALRIVGAGRVIGLSEAEVLSFSSALASVGVNAEAGGSAISRAFITIAESAESGGTDLRGFAAVAGLSADAFAEKFRTAPAEAMLAFIEGLGRMRKEGDDVFGTLNDLELGEIRVRDALLRAAGAGDLFREQLAIGSAEWKRNTALTEEARKRYRTTASELDLLKNSARDAAISLGDTLLSEARQFMPGLRETANEIADIFARTDIGLGEKFRLSEAAARKGLRPLLEAIEGMDLGGGLIDAFNAALPVIARESGQLGVEIAKGVAHGFVESDLLGKLVIGAGVFKLLGGAQLVQGAFQAGSAAAGGLAGGLRAGLLRGGIVGAGIFGALTIMDGLFGPSWQEELRADSADAAQQLRDSFAGVRLRRGTADAFRELSADLRTSADELRQWDEQAAQSYDEAADAAERFSQRSAESMAEVRFSIRQLRITFADSLGEIQGRTDAVMRRIDNTFERGTKGWVRHTSNAMDAQVGAIKRAMNRNLIDSDKGLKKIDELIKKKLSLYGIRDPARAIAEINTFQTLADVNRKARGGPVNSGAPSGDSVPSLLERGEYVLNRNAVRAVGRGVLDQLNFGEAARFATGGIVGLGRQLQRRGYEVGEHPAFGGVGDGHVDGSYHYRGMALDVNDDFAPFGSGSGEPGSLDRLAARLRAMPGVVELLWRVAGHFDHLHVAMADGATAALGGIGGPRVKLPRFAPLFPAAGPGAAGLNQVSRALEGRIAKLAFEGTETGIATQAGGQFSKGELARLWTQAGGPGGVANVAAAIALAESGGNPRARNPSGASGLWQILGEPFPGDVFDPLTNARMAVAKYRDAGGWSPWVAFTNGSYRQYLAAGGLAGEIKSVRDRLGEKKLKPADRRRLEAKLADLREQQRKARERRRRRRSRKIGSLAKFSPELRDQLAGAEGRIESLNEQIDVTDTTAANPTSELGSDMSEGEVGRLVALYRDLIAQLSAKRDLLRRLIEKAAAEIKQIDRQLKKKGLPDWKRSALRERRSKLRTLRTDAQSALTDTVGVTGQGGELFGAQDALSSLGATPPAESENQSALNALLKEQLGAAQRTAAVSEAQFGVFSGFFGDLGLPFLGAFAHGSGGRTVGTTGLALVHEDERITPDPDGPFGRRDSGPTNVTLVLAGDSERLVRLVDARIDGQAARITKRVDRSIGRAGRRRALGGVG